MDYPVGTSMAASSLLELGPAVTVAILLSDWDRYSLSERVWYHFGLTDALIGTDEQIEQRSREQSDQNSQQKPLQQSTESTGNRPRLGKNEEVCGVVRLLECVPTKQWHKLTRRQKRDLKNAIRSFNDEAMSIRMAKAVFCHEPRRLPLVMNPQTRVFFAYEVTRIAFCLDASPTLTSTFGFSGNQLDHNDKACCPMDRLADMARTFFTSLIEPIPTPSTTNKGVWKPCLAITILAVFPRASGGSPTNVLVRDFRVTDLESADLLCNKIEEWALGNVESEIARRLSHPRFEDQQNVPGAVLSSYDAGVIPMYSSSLRDLLHAGDAALTSLSSEAKPCIVVATDGRSVSCDGIIDIVSETERVDVPLVVLDLSSPTSHNRFSHNRSGKIFKVGEDSERLNGAQFHLMNFDPDGAMFPLHLSDDSEALYGVCKATGGVFFDSQLLREAVHTKAGMVDSNSPLASDHFFAFKRHSIQPNAVQWYILFALSPLSPNSYSATFGRLPPPEYIRRKLAMGEYPDYRRTATNPPMPGINPPIIARPDWQGRAADSSRSSSLPPSASSDLGGGTLHRKPQSRIIFSTYIINPIPIHGILLMRVKEGYRASKYGQSTEHPNRVSIQMVLPLDLGTVLHYELSYKALPGELWIGHAHIKIELSGDAGFIAMVKKDFLNQGGRGRLVTMAQQVSARLCILLRWIRKEDMLQSYLSPKKWTDQLASPETPFVRRLGTLSATQRKRHFRRDEFDCVCVGRMPWAFDDEFLREFQNIDSGEHELTETILEWSTQTIEEGKRYIKRTGSALGLAGYYIIELRRSSVASRLFTVVIETFGGSSAGKRHSILTSLKGRLGQLKDVSVQPKQIGQFLVLSRTNTLQCIQTISHKEKIFQSQLNHAAWDLVKDAELLTLLMRRRSEIGKFLLLESSETHAIFAKLAYTDSSATKTMPDPGDLVQYHLAVLEDKVVVDLHMENEGGIFFPSRFDRSIKKATGKRSSFVNKSKFQRMTMILKKRDQECGHALRCRTALLRIFGEGRSYNYEEDETPLSCVQRLLGYASRMSIRLRFFREGPGSTNIILQSLTEELLLSQSLVGANVAKLPIDPDSKIEDLDGGYWFVIEFDKHTLSIAHLPLHEEHEVSVSDGRSFTYRELTFFTVGITDLYNKRDDVADDGSDDGHISEHLQVSEISDYILAAHKQNYAAAAYLSLKHEGPCRFSFFDLDDFAEVMRPLRFVEITRVTVGAESGLENEESSKLLQLIGTVLHPIADEQFCLFYDGSENGEMLYSFLDDESDPSVYESSSGENSTNMATEDEEVSCQSQTDDDEVPSDQDDSLDEESNDADIARQTFVSAPVFVRFLLNDKPVTVPELAAFKESSTLSVLVSVFGAKNDSNSVIDKIDQSDLPFSHLHVAVELAGLFNAYVAEQTLERLRHHGSSIWEQESNLRLAKACLKKARNVVASTVDIFFYVGKIDEVVAASAPAGSNIEVDEGFNLLYSELQGSEAIPLKAYGGGGGFLVNRLENNKAALEFWCFINIRRARGVIAAEIYHPNGRYQASELMKSILETISMCCHRVNQLLLLRKLHQSRSASRLLVPPDPESSKGAQKVPHSEIENAFEEGVFRCPIVFRTSFDLFHRCATSPAQVARSLAATVLHIFAVSNRKQLFVYKDESGSIFYMGLSTTGGGVEADGQIELLVYGLECPGPSITSQLRGLLQKRLLLIAVDMLSSVLTKNPHYSWRQADIRFVRSFEMDWKALDDETTQNPAPSEKAYAFPVSAYDPGLILLYFRQNLCGSTFFHRLISSEWNDEEDGEEVPCNDATLRLTPTDLLFYYNNAPSKLDPKFQAQSTLTEQGARFSRQAGSGLAIIELTLINSLGKKMRDLNSANKPSVIESVLDIPEDNLRFHEVELSPNGIPTVNGNTQAAFVKVKITDTAAKREPIHKWILLTLNQVLMSWTIERILERKQRGLFRPVPLTIFREPCNIETAKKFVIETISQGMPVLATLFEGGQKLPHPAILKTETLGIVNSSSVATVTLDLLEKVIIEQLAAETKGKLSLDSRSYIIIRKSRKSKPRQVELKWDSSRRRALVYGDGNTINDSPIDCPEYTIFYYFPEYTEKRTNADPFLPKLYTEVLVGGDRSSETHGSAKSLQALKEKNYFACRRSFCFVFTVKRNRRTLLAYNWSAYLFKNIASRLRDYDASHTVSTEQSVGFLQKWALRELAPTCEVRKEKTATNVVRQEGPRPNPNRKRESAEEKSQPNQSRRVTRPLQIRRPKLVGKSVEGAAVHAVAASRARASANRFRGGGQPGTAPLSKIASDESRPDRKAFGSKRTVSFPRPPRARDQREELQEEDHELYSVKKDLSYILRRETFLRRITASALAQRHFIGSVWPIKLKENKRIAASVAAYFLARAPLAWNDVSEMLPIPTKLARAFLPSFGQTLTRLLPVRFVPLSTTNGSVFLMSKLRTVHSCKCFLVINVSTSAFKVDGQRKVLVNLVGRILTVKRSSAKDGNNALNTIGFMEKDSAGLDKLAKDILSGIKDLDGVLFDHAACIVERSMKSVDGDLEYHEAIRLLRQLILRFPLGKMMTMRSNYKCYEATIILRSYGDRLINMYDGPTLLSFLLSNLGDRNVVRCGPNAICFKREIIVRVTHSVCFLTCDKQHPEKLQLVILCRTQGKDLYEFMFRDGSHVAISILDNIAVESAGLAYEELKYAATSLHRDALWRLLSTSVSLYPPSQEQIKELLKLCSVQPFSFFLDNSADGQRFESTCRDPALFDFGRFASSMGKDPSFSPGWMIAGEEEQQAQNLFYLGGEDIFVLLTRNDSGLLEIHLVQREATAVKNKFTTMAIQKIGNFLLHFIWAEMSALH